MEQLALMLDPEIRVEPTAAVLLSGHRTVPYTHTPRPPVQLSGPAWADVLDVAEDQIRWRRSTEVPARFTTKPRDCVGGGAGRSGWIDYNGRGVTYRADRHDERQLVAWPALLQGLSVRARVEPQTARARDLAHCYHALHYYGGVYGDGPQRGYKFLWRDGDSDRHRALIQALAETCLHLGGDPTLLECSTSYMRAGIAAARENRIPPEPPC